MPIACSRPPKLNDADTILYESVCFDLSQSGWCGSGGKNHRMLGFISKTSELDWPSAKTIAAALVHDALRDCASRRHSARLPDLLCQVARPTAQARVEISAQQKTQVRITHAGAVAD
jgi:hypothetical protein